MPIKGLTDRGASFPEIGTIRKGAPKEPDRPGADLDYFRFIFDESTPEGVATAKKFTSIYGDEPREFKALLPFNDISDCWDAWIEGYLAGGLIYRSDGDKVIYWKDIITGQTKVLDYVPDTDCPASQGQPVGQYVSTGLRKKTVEVYAKPHGRLKLIIRGLGRFGFMVLKTTSQYDIGNISSQLEGAELAARALRNRGIAGVPLLIRRTPRQVSVPKEDGTRFKKEMWLISIEPDPEWAEKQAAAMMIAATPDVIEGHFLDIAPDDDFTNGDVLRLPEPKPPTEERPETERGKVSYWNNEVLAVLVEKGYADNTFNAAGMLSYSAFDRNLALGPALIYSRHYRAARDEGMDSRTAGERGMAAFLETLKKDNDNE